MTNDLHQIALVIVLFLVGMGGLLVVMTKLEPQKGTHRADRDHPVRLPREG